MPWAKLTYDRTVSVYKDLLEETLINHQKDIDLIIRELLVRGEILKHDFTKRQLTILMFIITFSFNYGKETAYIPKLQDFEVAGISKKHIKNELNKLMEMKWSLGIRKKKHFPFKSQDFGLIVHTMQVIMMLAAKNCL